MLYCDCLTWASLGQVGWAAWRQRLPKKLQIFDFSESSPLLVQMLRWSGWHVAPCDFVYGELQDETGVWLYARVMYDLNNLAGQVIDQQVSGQAWFQHAERFLGAGKVRLIFIRRVHELLHSALLQTHLTNCLTRPRPAYLILRTTVANAALRQYARDLNVTLNFYWQLPPLLNKWASSWWRRFRAPRVLPKISIMPVIWYQKPQPDLPGILLTHDIVELTLDHSIRSFPHWLPSTRMPPLPHLTYILKRDDLPVTRAAYDELRAANIQVIGLRFDLNSPHIPVLAAPKLTWRACWQGYRALFLPRYFFNYVRQLFWVLWVGVLAEKKIMWQHYLSQLNIKLYVTRQPWLHEGLESALSAVGGWAVVYQYSNLSLPHPAMSSTAEVLFIFAARFADFYQRAHSTAQFFAVGGYLYDQAQTLAKARAQQVRQTLHNAGAHFIICVFDENWSTGLYAPVNRAMHVAFLKFFLEWLVADPTLGLVLKMQYAENTPPHFVELYELYEQAHQTERLHIFGEGHYTIRNLPVEAALTADLVVNHIYGATAGLEAALAGVRTVLLDPHNYSLSPLKVWGQTNIVFNSLAAIKHAVTAFRAHDLNAQALGDWSLFLAQLDPFRDGQAHARFADLLNYLLQAQIQKHSLRAALQDYQTQWGAVSVFESAKVSP